MLNILTTWYITYPRLIQHLIFHISKITVIGHVLSTVFLTLEINFRAGMQVIYNNKISGPFFFSHGKTKFQRHCVKNCWWMWSITQLRYYLLCWLFFSLYFPSSFSDLLLLSSFLYNVWFSDIESINRQVMYHTLHKRG